MSITLSSHAAFIAALEGARRITLSSYALTQDMADELSARADYGAEVHVRLAAHLVGDASGARAAGAARMVAELREHGVDAALTAPGDSSPHAKAATVDGIVWLDDRNFPRKGPDLIIRDDDPADARAAAAWLDGSVPHSDRLTFTKSDALAQEAAAITAAPPGEIDLSTEDIGTGNIELALRARLAAGDHVRVLVDFDSCTSSSARSAIALLEKAGAEIRSRRALDKLTVTAGSAWIGSANASHDIPRTAGQSDWGLVTTQADAVVALRQRFDAAWSGASPTSLTQA
ncbi:MAG: hypothetical protein GIX03_11050 [Candidatus Eremiobacteraeota bacterium]|nr:hypothetical protein [Candidatus Eremiobacteraeota bacterium]